MKKQSHVTYPSFLKFCVAAVIGTGPLLAGAGVPEFNLNARATAVISSTDRMIVKYKDASASGAKGLSVAAAAEPDRMAVVQRAGQQFGLSLKVLRTTASGANILKLDRKMNVSDVAALAKELMERDPSVEYAEPDRIMRKMFTPNDASYTQQWNYFEATGGLRLPTAWDLSTGTGVVVAVIDTGYRPHIDLTGQFLPGYDFIVDTAISNDGNGRDNDARDPGDAVVAGECGNGEPAEDETSSWHGTHVAGTIAALTNNTTGVSGVAYGAKVLPLRVLGKCGGYTSDIADAIVWASAGTVTGVPANPNKARVINMSLGGPGACDTTTQNAINSARSRGTVIIVAAGNDNANASGFSPASCSGVVTVAATNRSGGRAYYSNFGALVDVAAPGGDARVAGGGILSTLNSGTTTPLADNYAFYQGTSMAAPHVAGVAALMLAKNPNLTPDEIESKLKSTARPFPATCTSCGAGIVDATAAVNSASGGVVTVTINETEANNTTATANAVTASSTIVNGNLGSTTDTDYFSVQLPAGKTLSATLTPGSSTLDYDLYAYNSAGTQVALSEADVGQVDSLTTANTGTTTVVRYVRVKYFAGGTGATNGKYTLKLSW